MFLDSYCERAGGVGLLAEPLNLVTNAAFLIAGWLVIRLLQNAGDIRSNIDIYLLSLILALIGIGSGLWHAVPAEWSILMDVVPIYLFINLYLWSYHRRILGFSLKYIFIIWVGFTVLSVWFELNISPDTLGGTILYIPTYAILALMAILTWKYAKTYFKPFLSIIALWTVSLTLRTIDLPVCNSIPSGTHFLWHIINAIVLYNFLKLLVRKDVLG